MKKKLVSVIMAMTVAASVMACGSSDTATETETATEETTEEAAEETEEAAEATEETTEEAAEATEEASTEETAEETTEDATAEVDATQFTLASEGKLIMATNAEFPPYEYHENDTIVGIDAEVAALIAEKLGLEFEIEDIAFDSVIPEVISGKADMGMAGMTVTEERKQSVNFSDTYATGIQAIIVPEGSEIASADDLAGKIIGVQTGTTGDIYATDDYGDENIERYAKGMEAVQALSQGKIDAVIIDNEPAKVFVSETEGLTILESPYVEEEYAIAVSKENEALLEAINGALAELKEDGTLDEIVAKYITAE
ncbi:MAG: transporter substrate-binding domain-containing protein [Butyrivibrio sp.]|nr:transporter substrate-binding domain-containing protein [Butyrivibrio sp.]